MKTAIIIAAAVLAACNQARPPATPVAGAADAKKLTLAGETFSIRLLGVDPGGAQAVLVGIRELRATAGGVDLPIQMGGSAVDLAQPDQAWLLGRVTVPAGIAEIGVELRFDDFGGLESAGGPASIRARGAKVAFTAPLEWLRLNGHAVVHLDLARSLDAERAGERRLLPVLAVHY